jgi:hypothetical protein
MPLDTYSQEQVIDRRAAETERDKETDREGEGEREREQANLTFDHRMANVSCM